MSQHSIPMGTDSPILPASTATAGTEPAQTPQPSLYRRLATSQSPFIKALKAVRRGVICFSLPAPRVLVLPMLWTYLALRTSYYFFLRVFICEPIFKAYCKKYGKGLRTDCFIHFILGKGDIVLGDNVWMDGKITIIFGATFADAPLFEVGDGTAIGHDCRFAIGKRVSIGKNCNLSGGTIVMDSNGHQTDPRARIDHAAPTSDEVRPVTIGDNVWIGMNCLIFPGVKIGEGAVVSAGSVVRSHVPSYSVVAGNPAKVQFRLKRPEK